MFDFYSHSLINKESKLELGVAKKHKERKNPHSFQIKEKQFFFFYLENPMEHDV